MVISTRQGEKSAGKGHQKAVPDRNLAKWCLYLPVTGWVSLASRSCNIKLAGVKDSFCGCLSTTESDTQAFFLTRTAYEFFIFLSLIDLFFPE